MCKFSFPIGLDSAPVCVLHSYASINKWSGSKDPLVSCGQTGKSSCGMPDRKAWAHPGLPENSIIKDPQAAASVCLSVFSCRAARLQVLTVSRWGLFGHDSPHHHRAGLESFPLISVVFTHCQAPRLSFLEPGILFVMIFPVPSLGTLPPSRSKHESVMRPRWDGSSSTLLLESPVVLGRRFVGLTTVCFRGAQVPSSSGSEDRSKDTGYLYAVNSHTAVLSTPLCCVLSPLTLTSLFPLP